ncbi:hypothetical protein ACH4TX_12330 [Streptomyces sp. NPDC021098]|uniref:hypothetical protein n=1 Tax=unclassified Streptomyces TaxID=2593676 RepID=UPI0037AB5B17
MAFRRDKNQSGEWEKPYFQQRGWLISAGFLLAMVGLAGVAALYDGGSSEGGADATQGQHSASPSAPPSEEGGAPSGNGRPAGCRTDDSDQRKPTKAPADMRWKNIGSETVPTSPSAGPLTYDNPVWSCFAHTPMGAVMAAHSIIQHIPYAGWRELAEKQMVPGKNRETFLRERAGEEDRKLSAPSQGSQYAGFSVLGYSKEKASIMILIKFSEVYFTLPVDTEWRDGDWKLVLRKDGSYSPDPTMVDSTNGFVMWGK